MGAVIRIITILLAITLASPAAAWGGSMVPGGIDRIGFVCCGVQSQAEQQEPQERQEIDSTCCCRPAPVVPGASVSLRAPVSSEEPVLQAPLASHEAQVSSDDAAPAVRLALYMPARGPPQVGPLLVQKTSLVL